MIHDTYYIQHVHHIPIILWVRKQEGAQKLVDGDT